jgi:CrcB protein
MVLNITLVAIGGFFGAISRFGLSGWIKSRLATIFPIATLLINLIGSFLLGIIIGANFSNDWRLLFGTGFMGAFTTFSTFKLENIQLHMSKKWNVLILYIGISYIFGILFAFAGMKLGSTL